MARSRLKIYLTILLALIIIVPISSQTFPEEIPDRDSLSKYIQLKYGLDQELINGFQYYNHFIRHLGHPFFPDDEFHEGTVSIKAKQFDDVLLKYDCYSQQLILKYDDLEGSYNLLILNNLHLSSFSIGDYNFQKFSIKSGQNLFYQVINSGTLSVYIHWKKNLMATNTNLKNSHEFGKTIRKYYLNHEGEIQSFKSRASFRSFFPDSQQKEIKKYFRQEQISIRKANPAEIQDLLDFMISLNQNPKP